MISVFLVFSAIFLTLYQMLRQKQMSSLCTKWNHLQGTNTVGMLHMLHTEPSELYLLLFQYCQLSKPLQKEKNYYSPNTEKKKMFENMCISRSGCVCSVMASKFLICKWKQNTDYASVLNVFFHFFLNNVNEKHLSYSSERFAVNHTWL